MVRGCASQGSHPLTPCSSRRPRPSRASVQKAATASPPPGCANRPFLGIPDATLHVCQRVDIPKFFPSRLVPCVFELTPILDLRPNFCKAQPQIPVPCLGRLPGVGLSRRPTLLGLSVPWAWRCPADDGQNRPVVPGVVEGCRWPARPGRCSACDGRLQVLQGPHTGRRVGDKFGDFGYLVNRMECA